MAKLFIKELASIYEVKPDLIIKFYESYKLNNNDPFPNEKNEILANFIGKKPLSLKRNKKVTKKETKHKKIKIKTNNLLNINIAKKYIYDEKAVTVQVSKQTKTTKNYHKPSKISISNEVKLVKNYFKIEDIFFTENVVKLNPQRAIYNFATISNIEKIKSFIIGKIIEYFERDYFTFYTNASRKVVYSESKDLISITSIILNSVEEVKREKKLLANVSVKSSTKNNSNLLASVLIDIEKSEYLKNPYVEIILKNFKSVQKIYTTKEYVNGNLENVLIFTGIEKKNAYVIVENLNQNRALYIFFSNKNNLDDLFTSVVSLIQLERNRKKYDLYVNKRMPIKETNVFRIYHTDDISIFDMSILHFKKSFN